MRPITEAYFAIFGFISDPDPLTLLSVLLQQQWRPPASADRLKGKIRKWAGYCVLDSTQQSIVRRAIHYDAANWRAVLWQHSRRHQHNTCTSAWLEVCVPGNDPKAYTERQHDCRMAQRVLLTAHCPIIGMSLYRDPFTDHEIDVAHAIMCHEHARRVQQRQPKEQISAIHQTLNRMGVSRRHYSLKQHHCSVTGVLQFSLHFGGPAALRNNDNLNGFQSIDSLFSHVLAAEQQLLEWQNSKSASLRATAYLPPPIEDD